MSQLTLKRPNPHQQLKRWARYGNNGRRLKGWRQLLFLLTLAQYRLFRRLIGGSWQEWTVATEKNPLRVWFPVKGCFQYRATPHPTCWKLMKEEGR